MIGGLPPGTPAAFEAGFGWSWLVQLLEDYGFAPRLVWLAGQAQADLSAQIEPHECWAFRVTMPGADTRQSW